MSSEPAQLSLEAAKWPPEQAKPPGAKPLVLGVLASGRGTNLQAILDACRSGELCARVALVLSDRRDAQALERARAAGVEARWVDPKAFPTREAYDRELSRLLEAAGVELVCLAGFMRILSPWFVRRWPNRVMNIHPSLLPAFPGKDAQRQAVEYGVRISGCTVHFVDEGVDTGPIILQAAVPVEPDDTPERLAERILEHEHRLYVQAIRLYAQGRLQVEGRRVRILAPSELPPSPQAAASTTSAAVPSPGGSAAPDAKRARCMA